MNYGRYPDPGHPYFYPNHFCNYPVPSPTTISSKLAFLLIAAFSMFIGHQSVAQSMTADSVNSKLKIAYGHYEKFVKSSSDGQDNGMSTGEEGDDGKGVEYGIGNVLGQKKKSDKVYKKSGRPFRVQLRVGHKVLVDYELSYGPQGLALRRKYH